VEAHLEANDIKNDNFLMYLKTLLILIFWMVSFYYSMIQGYIVASFVYGFFNAHLGVSISHDGSHGSYSRNKYINFMASYMTDFMGGSWIVWTMQHNIGHHPHTNRQGDYEDEDFDPDARSGFPLVRLSPYFVHRMYHRYQHWYIWLLFPFVGIKWMYGDFKYLSKRKYQKMDFWKFSTKSIILQISTKSLFFGLNFFLPLYLHGMIKGLILCCILFAVNSLVFSLLFAVNHLTDETIFPSEAEVEKDWAKLQVVTTSNYGTDSTLCLWMSGGLNFQIEHHLFPYLCHVHLPKISAIVKQTCKQYDVHYSHFATYSDAIRSYYNHLKIMGNPLEMKDKAQ